MINDEAELLTHVTSANIACGGHAGDAGSMRRTIRLSKERGVTIGAHPSFADRIGFGRREIEVTREDVEALVACQIERLIKIAWTEHAQVLHVKPHGALYNAAARNRDVAGAIARAVASVDTGLTLYGLSGSVLLDAGRDAGLAVASEVFADRAYMSDGSLRSRLQPGAVLNDPDIVVARVVRMVTEGTVVAFDGTVVNLSADTICVHSDTSGASNLAQRLHFGLEVAGIRVTALNAPEA